MRPIRSALLYLAIALGANTVAADPAAWMAMRDGDMKKLNFHSEPREVSQQAFFLENDGGTATLAEYRGKVMLVNFWATWCAPCRAEMPSLDALQAAMGGDDFEVLTLATGRNSASGLTKFFAEAEIRNLPLHTDPRQAVAREMGVLGLPVTVILNREGQEIARLTGDADWNSDYARTLLLSVIESTPES